MSSQSDNLKGAKLLPKKLKNFAFKNNFFLSVDFHTNFIASTNAHWAHILKILCRYLNFRLKN